jgi:ribonuclease BN (tRNA processing enzyme)
MRPANSAVQLHCVGSGDAFGSGGRLSSCYHLAVNGDQLLVDCGSSSLIGLQRCGLKPIDISSVVVSHLHGDHFGGIPYLLLEGKYASQRRQLLTLIGPPGLQQQVEGALSALYPGTLEDGLGFPVHYVTLQAQVPLQINSFLVEPWPVKHGSNQHVYGLRIEAGGKTISYTGDTEWTENLLPLAQGSDLLIAECFAYDRPTPSHLDYQTLMKQRHRLDCRRLMLTHMGPEVLAQLDNLEMETLSDGELIEL